MRKYLAIILNSLLLIFGLIGLYFTIFGDGFMNAGSFMYYTVQSNILAMLTAAIVLIFEIRKLGGLEIPTGVQFLRLFSTIAITLTFLVFSIMLTPVMIKDGQGWYLATPGNLCVHNLVPICAILDWCLCASARNFKKAAIFCGTVPAILYVCYAYTCVGLGHTFGTAKDFVPYFFLDYKTYGWFAINNNGNIGIGVAYWIVILAIVLITLGRLFIWIARRMEK